MDYDGGEFLRALWAASLHWTSRAVGFAMAVHGAEGTGRCVMSVEALAGFTGLPCQSIERGLAELTEAGFLARDEDQDRYSDNEALRSAVGPDVTRAQ